MFNLCDAHRPDFQTLIMGGGDYERDVSVAPSYGEGNVFESHVRDSRFPPQPYSQKAEQVLGSVTEIHNLLK